MLGIGPARAQPPQLAVEEPNGLEAAATAELVESGLGDRTWLAPDGKPLPFGSVEEILEFLATAKPVESEAISTGVTEPRKLLLERDGVHAHAIFHDVRIVKPRERLGGKVVIFFRDHYANNVAAFELSRLLGMTNVPPAVVRTVRRKKGSVQLWIEGSNTEADRRRLGIVPPGDWQLTGMDMRVYDNLVNNMLYDSNWNLWLIDHTRAFGRNKKLPSPGRVTGCSRRLLQSLRELDEAEVRRVLQPYLGTSEIAGLLHRHNRLLTLIGEKIDEKGEAAVLFSYDEPPPSAAGADDPAIPEAPPS